MMFLSIIPGDISGIKVNLMNTGFFTIYKRDMRRFLRFKHQLLSSLLQPVLWLGFFGMAMAGNFDRILGGTTRFPGVPEVNYLTFMCAGIISATVLFTNIYGGFFLLFDKNWGILREIMASPMPRRNIILGIALSAVTKSWVQAVIILLFGMVLGVSLFSGQDAGSFILSAVGVLLFIAVFSVIFLCISLTLAVKMDSPEGFQGVSTLLTMPLFFLSNSLYPMDDLPEVVRYIALLNPLTHLTTALRYFTIGDSFGAIGVLFTYNPGEILFSFGYLLCLAIIFFVIAWRAVEHAIVT
jgi:ABC-2 type transport system permease protein